MHDSAFPQTDLSGLSKADWIEGVFETAEDLGFNEHLDRSHFAAFLDVGPHLLVTFETVQGMQGLTEEAEPIGWQMSRAHGWSHLLLASDGETWFRNDRVFAFFDRLEDDGFFEDFETVVFYGAGPCGYAAAAYSVAAPGARVVAVQPQASLAPDVAGWDDRFTEMRRLDFTNRYGYAPDMIDAADHAYVIFDPYETLDAMHAALFRRANVSALKMPMMGSALQGDLLTLDLLAPLLRGAMTGGVDPLEFARGLRKRRDHLPYLRKLLARVDAKDHDDLALVLCRNVTARLDAPRFARRLRAQDEDGG